MARKFVESPEMKLYFWNRYRRLVPLVLAVLVLAVGFVVGCQGDSKAVAPMDSAVQAAAVPSADPSSSLSWMVGREYRHLHVPLVRIEVIGVQDGAVINAIRFCQNNAYDTYTCQRWYGRISPI